MTKNYLTPLTDEQIAEMAKRHQPRRPTAGLASWEHLARGTGLVTLRDFLRAAGGLTASSSRAERVAAEISTEIRSANPMAGIGGYRTITVPFDYLTRATSVTTGTAQHLVPQNGPSFVHWMNEATSLIRLARVYEGLVGSQKVTSGPLGSYAASMGTEVQSLSESAAPTFRSVTLSPRPLRAMASISRTLWLNETPESLEAIRRQLTVACAIRFEAFLSELILADEGVYQDAATSVSYALVQSLARRLEDAGALADIEPAMVCDRHVQDVMRNNARETDITHAIAKTDERGTFVDDMPVFKSGALGTGDDGESPATLERRLFMAAPGKGLVVGVSSPGADISVDRWTGLDQDQIKIWCHFSIDAKILEPLALVTAPHLQIA